MTEHSHTAVARALRLKAYQIDRCRDAPPAGSPAERWVETGTGDVNPLWGRIAEALAQAMGARSWPEGLKGCHDR